jgi:hypothetical protein
MAWMWGFFFAGFGRLPLNALAGVPDGWTFGVIIIYAMLLSASFTASNRPFIRTIE